eukprot:scaffold14167_cov155-Skeletonema_marinoi.AAC.1
MNFRCSGLYKHTPLEAVPSMMGWYMSSYHPSPTTQSFIFKDEGDTIKQVGCKEEPLYSFERLFDVQHGDHFSWLRCFDYVCGADAGNNLQYYGSTKIQPPAAACKQAEVHP